MFLVISRYHIGQLLFHPLLVEERKLKGYLNSTDIDATINACRAIGADIKEDIDSLIIDGNNLEQRHGR